MSLAEYVTQLFPGLGPRAVATVVQVYNATFGTKLAQAVAIMGECTSQTRPEGGCGS